MHRKAVISQVVCARHSSLCAAMCVAGLTMLTHCTGAAVSEAWVHRYSNAASNSIDNALKVVTDALGDVIVAGHTDDGFNFQDMLTIKYSGATGNRLWQRRYNGPANDHDSAEALTVDRNGNAVIVGYSFNGTNYDCYAAKYAAANGALLWEHRYNGPPDGNDDLLSVGVDADDNVIVTGYSQRLANSEPDFYTAKYAAADGTLLWENRDSGLWHIYGVGVALAIDRGGNAVVTGYFYNGNDYDYYTAKYASADGALLWEKVYNSGPNRSDFARAVAVDGNDNVVVTGGSSVSIESRSDLYTVKYASADGTTLWEQRYNGSGNDTDEGKAVAVDRSGNVVVTGYSYSSGFATYDFYTAKYAAEDGRLLWENSYNSPASSYDQAAAVATDTSGDVVVTGHSANGGNSYDYYTAKYASRNGALLWERRYSGSATGDDEARSVAMDFEGNALVTGRSAKGSDYDYYTAKYAATNGELLWESSYNGLANVDDEGRAVTVDGNGNVAVTGYSYGNGSGRDFYTAKYAGRDGRICWEQRYDGAGGADDEAMAIAVDQHGNFVVTGYSYGDDSGRDYYTAKYAAESGTLVWERRYDGSAHRDDGARAVAVDSSGNVAVTGLSYGSVSSADFYTAKYAAADGALLWEMRYNMANNFDFAQAVAVDSSGNVVVTGSANGGDYYTAKYAAADGTLLWEQSYNGPGNYLDVAQSVAVDRSGNVVVTGYSYGIRGNRDYYTANYAAVDGKLLWEKRYDGPGNSDDEARSVAVDGSGNVFVTGFSYNTNQNVDYYTAKYAAEDGALLWEQRYDGPVSGYDAAQGVLADGNDDIVVTGYSTGPGWTYDYFTAKYAGTNGLLLWQTRYDGPAHGEDIVSSAGGLAIGVNGMVAITGSSRHQPRYSPNGSPDPRAFSDYATVVYRENLPPQIECPTNLVAIFSSHSGTVVTFALSATDDSGLSPRIDCVPPDPSLFPIGETTVTCTAADADGLSNACSFRVIVLGGRGVKEQILAELIALRATPTDWNESRILDRAISALKESLMPALWLDPTHLETKHGEQVFREGKETLRNLCHLVVGDQKAARTAILQGLIERMLQVDRLLASVAIQEPLTDHLPNHKIEQAQRFLAKGDAARGDKCDNGIDDYKNAWQHAVRIEPSSSASPTVGGAR
jgi:uncharacterized delta-60 repeat protein